MIFVLFGDSIFPPVRSVELLLSFRVSHLDIMALCALGMARKRLFSSSWCLAHFPRYISCSGDVGIPISMTLISR